MVLGLCCFPASRSVISLFGWQSHLPAQKKERLKLQLEMKFLKDDEMTVSSHPTRLVLSAWSPSPRVLNYEWPVNVCLWPLYPVVWPSISSFRSVRWCRGLQRQVVRSWWGPVALWFSVSFLGFHWIRMCCVLNSFTYVLIHSWTHLFFRYLLCD